MTYLLMALFAAGAVALDQWTKALTVASIPLHSRVPFWDGLFHFTYLQNTGAAFSSFQGQQWLFALIFAVFTLLLLVELRKNSMGFRPLERWCIVAIWAGGLGNMIDRVRLGYVVDMIEVEFIRFPVFNVADCFITCGCVLLIAHLVLFNREFWKDEKKKQSLPWYDVINLQKLELRAKNQHVIANQCAHWCGDRRECLWCNPPDRSRYQFGNRKIVGIATSLRSSQ